MPIQTAADSINNSAGSPFGFKNRIINGAMAIDQRNAGASYTPATNTYYVDRWEYEVSQNSKLTGQQNQGSVTPPAGFINYVGSTSSSAFSVGVTDYFLLTQPIEGYNVADLGWGTANAKTVTLSFWVRSSLTGTFGGSINNVSGNRSFPFSYTISSANTWTQASVTITGDTTGTWSTTNTVGMYVRFSLGTGATYSGTVGSWSGSLLLGATGATSVVGTSGATFYITGVQLEKGSQATAFDYRDYGRELIMCQRYFGSYPQTNGTYWYNISNGGYRRMHYNFPVIMRSTPSCTVAGATNANPAGSLGVDATSVTTCVVSWNHNDAGGLVYWNSSALITASAEL